MSQRAVLAVGAALLLAALARGPLHVATFAQPISNDDALILLMARAVASGEVVAGFWNQPYGGALDAWLLAPLARWVPPHGLFRAYQAACALGLMAVVGLLARRVGGPSAGAAAVVLAASGPPYLALMGALGLAPYLLAPLLLAPLALLSLRYAVGGHVPSLGAALLAGLLAGLDTWNTLLAAPAAAGLLAGAVAARRDRSWLRPAGAFGLGAALGLLPVLLASSGSGDAVGSVAGLRPAWLWPAAAADLGRAAAGLFGLAPPVVIDGPNRVPLPWVVQAVLALALVVTIASGARQRGSWPLLFWSLAAAAAFVVGARGRGDRVRYLVLAAPPLLAVAGIGLASLRARPVTAGVLAAALIGPWIVGAHGLAAAWRDPQQAPRFWGAVDLQPAAATLSALGIRTAYATNQLAARLAVTGAFDLRATPAWNERFPGHPLRWSDDVDLDPRPAWVLHDEISRGMPRAAAFRALLREMGGTWKETRAGAMTVFHGFVPPYDEQRPVAIVTDPPAWSDRDVTTTSAGSHIEVRLPQPSRVTAMVLVLPDAAQPDGCQLLLDGVSRAAATRREGFQWANGAPRAGRQVVRVMAIGGDVVQHVALTCPAALAVAEIFLYGPDAEARPEAGAAAAAEALEATRRGHLGRAEESWRTAVRAEPWRASYHAGLARVLARR